MRSWLKLLINKCGILFLIGMVFLLNASFAQKLGEKETAQIKQQILKLQKEIGRLSDKLGKTKSKTERDVITDKIDLFRGRIKNLNKKLEPKPILKPGMPAVTPEAVIAVEGAEESALSAEAESKVKQIAKRFRYEAGGATGVFAGATTLTGEIRIPFGLILGPATTAFRISTGLAQSRDTSLRYVPLNLDFILNFPPGWFTGVENYIGAGANYVALMSGGKQGTVGGEIFYGIQSDGLGGIIFGELGWGILRTGFSPSHKGVTVLIGYRTLLGSR